ncbi:Putative RNA-directed DNA polymerase [Arachis hypogaea]|nr:Putative RNA-directed DNA polymerase [Arachis hypogaea]
MELRVAIAAQRNAAFLLRFKNRSGHGLHCKPTPPPQGVAYCRHPSVYLASLVLQVFNPCSLSPIAVASSSSASVVFVCSAAVCLPFTLASSFSRRLRSRSSLFKFARRSPFGFAFAFVWKPRWSASNAATNPRAPPSRRTALFYRRRCVWKRTPKPSTTSSLSSLSPKNHRFTDSHLSTSLTAVPHVHRRTQRQPTKRTSLVTPLAGSSASSPRRQCLLASAFSVCDVPAALAPPCLACLCFCFLRRHRVGSSAVSALLVSKFCALSTVACSATVQHCKTTPSWKTAPDSVSDFLLLQCRVVVLLLSTLFSVTPISSLQPLLSLLSPSLLLICTCLSREAATFELALAVAMFAYVCLETHEVGFVCSQQEATPPGHESDKTASSCLLVSLLRIILSLFEVGWWQQHQQ